MRPITISAKLIRRAPASAPRLSHLMSGSHEISWPIQFSRGIRWAHRNQPQWIKLRILILYVLGPFLIIWHLLLFVWFKDSCKCNFHMKTNCPLVKTVKHSAPIRHSVNLYIYVTLRRFIAFLSPIFLTFIRWWLSDIPRAVRSQSVLLDLIFKIQQQKTFLGWKRSKSSSLNFFETFFNFITLKLIQCTLFDTGTFLTSCCGQK